MNDTEKLDLIISKLGTIENKVDSLEGRFDSLESKVDSLEGRFDSLESKVDSLEGRFDSLESKVNALETELSDIKLILENEIRINIQRVAEGHLDLSRNLHEALKIDNEKEMLSIRVSVLETELRKIKRQLETA